MVAVVEHVLRLIHKERRWYSNMPSRGRGRVCDSVEQATFINCILVHAVVVAVAVAATTTTSSVVADAVPATTTTSSVAATTATTSFPVGVVACCVSVAAAADAAAAATANTAAQTSVTLALLLCKLCCTGFVDEYVHAMGAAVLGWCPHQCQSRKSRRYFHRPCHFV